MELGETRPRAGETKPTLEGRRVYLHVFFADSSRAVLLPEDGEVFIGRAPECGVLLEGDDGVSRKHVRLELRHGVVSLSDLGSHNGTRVNGRPVAPNVNVALAPGDAIMVSDTTLVLHSATRPAQPRPVQGVKAFQERLDAEVERSAKYERSFVVACVRLTRRPASAAALEAKLGEVIRLMDVAAWVDDELLVLFPELERREAPVAVERLIDALAPLADDVRGGYAEFPADGAESAPLLLAARQAAGAAPVGALESADRSVREVQLGPSRTVLVADPSMARVYQLLERLGKAALPVLVLGETGSGKENAAFAVHHFSSRAAGPFVSINCAGLPETLLESELFGFEKGAFSGATAAKPGLFEAAHGGTIFLDELGELSLAAQARLLRVLENKTLLRLGSIKERTIDVRVVAATHRNLQNEVKAGRFRQDLYFRLSAATVSLPALRERQREIALLARHFLAGAASAAGREAPTLSARAMALLCGHDWPGNVRELKNAMEYAVATTAEPVIELEHLPPQLTGTVAPAAPAPGAAMTPATEVAPVGFVPLSNELRALEKRRILEALEAAGGVQTRAAELIGMPRRTFVLRLRELKLR
ncbi:MAG: sigma 54-interacting transcriptional regulator [Archangium sp.]